MKIFSFKAQQDRLNVFFCGLPIYYKRYLDNSVRHRFLFLNWESPLPYEIFKLNELKDKIEKIVASKTRDNQKEEKNFPFETIPDNTVLLIETNNFHSELLPGIARYFVDLGYNVDILLSYYESKLNPFSRYLFRKIRIKTIESGKILEILDSKKIKKYSFIYFNSDKVNYHKSFATDYFSKIDYPENRKIFMLHHPDASSYQGEGHVCMLGDFTFKGRKPFIVTPTYFGNIKINPKNNKTRFIVIGNVDQKRKNFSLLLKSAEELVNENKKDFEIVVVSRQGDISIPPSISEQVRFLGKLSYEEMYSEIEKSDFFLALLDTSIPEHERYASKGISGTFLLSWGFRKPCIIEEYFAAKYNFDINNSVIYKNSASFTDSLRSAIEMDRRRYLDMQMSLSENVMKIAEKSIENLENFIPDLRSKK